MIWCRRGAPAPLGRVASILASSVALFVLAGGARSEEGAQPEVHPPVRVRSVDVDAIPTGPSVEERLAEIRRRIQAAVEYPSRARRRGLEGVATVGFEIDRADGRARGIELVASSGHPSLDQAAERSVVRAGFLPWVYGRLHVPVRFALDEEG